MRRPCARVGQRWVFSRYVLDVLAKQSKIQVHEARLVMEGFVRTETFSSVPYRSKRGFPIGRQGR